MGGPGAGRAGLRPCKERAGAAASSVLPLPGGHQSRKQSGGGQGWRYWGAGRGRRRGGGANGLGVKEGNCLSEEADDPQKTAAQSGALGGGVRSLPRDRQ